ncbi:hypothetical protein FGADI_7287 [Fusarium gaditjirri]|uniref:Myb-like domain-containing protein n=1 Tax=Fusarium gaditjirri TaxID=282569 RepID=A0A8H4WUX0_9HYPO|nr:hypothetical protein FGADI_7287 [Fusarium gaditjirri]
MTSLIINSEQRKLLQSFTPPASQPDTASLHDKEAHSALGKSRDTAICIPSDVESDTEDEDDARQELDGSQSFTALTSTVDYLDLTLTEHGATESEPTIGANTASAVSATQVDAALGWPNEPRESHLADAGLSQQSCGMNHLLLGNTSTECQDISFATPPTSPESQPYPVAADGKQLQSEPTSQESNMVVDGVSDYGVCHSSQGYPDRPSTGAHSRQTANPVEVVQASFQETEIPAGKSCDDAIPEVRIPSHSKSSDEPCQGQALDDTSSASTYVESETTEARSSSDAEVSSTSSSLHRFRYKSSQVHKTMQCEDCDAGSEESGNEDRTCRLGSQYREKNSSSLPNVENPDSEDDELDDVHLGRKRPKVFKSSSCTGTSSRSSGPRGQTAQAQQLKTSTQTSEHNIPSPTPSREIPIPPVAELFAQFEEWPLGGAVLKRITEGTKTTFQLQFEWDPTSCQPHGDRLMSRLKRKRLPDISHLLSKSQSRSRPEADNSLSTSDTIYVADSSVDAPDSDDNMSNGSDSEYNSDRDIVKEHRYQTFRRKKVQRRRWTMEDDDLLRRLKQDGLPDSEIAPILKRTEGGVKQHWDIIERAQRYEKTKEA